MMVGNLIQFFALRGSSSGKQGAYLGMLTQALQGGVTLAVGIILFSFLYADIVSAWIAMIVCWLFWGIEYVFDRYYVKRWIP